MKPRQDTYPVFEANQVLTNEHLNEMFNYLDDQERLTRANLIGVGVVCGLEIKLVPATPAVHLSRGCGVTSSGFLIVEQEDVVLTSYRRYSPPAELEYPPFTDKNADPEEPIPLWEMFPPGEPETTPLDDPANFLDDKAMLLFLELKKEGLRTCSPNVCDDKGEKVAASVRRLLVRIDDLGEIIAEACQLTPGLTCSDLEAALTARLNLPDIRLPRYDAPNTGIVTSREVLSAFHAVFHTGKLAQRTGEALDAAYNSFRPILEESGPTNPFESGPTNPFESGPTNPFTGFSTVFGFLDHAPANSEQARFLPYYYDFFDDLLEAYDAFRWKGVELMCACCPSESQFPRHLMLGVLNPASVNDPDVYRHRFIASPAVSGCEALAREVVQLFHRLVEMTIRFTHTPPLPEPSRASVTDRQIRITPSRMGRAPLSDKAIPYYYLLDGDPPLHHLWNVEKTRRGRANQNLAYRSDEYTPAPPAFVADPLRYDLAPYNFLRIEGHLGKDYRDVLKTLLTLKARHRLPIDVIALRTGPFDENTTIDPTKEACRFQDLETLYDALREELLGKLCEGVMYFYNIPIPEIPGLALPGGAPRHPLLKKNAPNFRFDGNTVGAWCEHYLPQIQQEPYIDVDQDNININEALKVHCLLFQNTMEPEPEFHAHVVSAYYLTKLSETMPPDLDELNYANVENKYQDLTGLVRYFRGDAKNDISTDWAKFIPQEDLIDQFDRVLFTCKLAPLKAIYEEYERRIREVEQKRFLGWFLKKNPGIQHKAGVPMGGSFIIVYHEAPKPLKFMPQFKRGYGRSDTPDFGMDKADSALISGAVERIRAQPELVANPDIRLMIGAVTGQAPDIGVGPKPSAGEDADEIIEAAVGEFPDGAVIADFFLPYMCCSESTPIQYVLPTPPLGLSVELACTRPDGVAEAALTPQGGMAPFSYKLDDQPFRELTGKPLLSAGSHTLVIRDGAGSESAPRTFVVPKPLVIGEESYIDDPETMSYQVKFYFSGGAPPYTSTAGTIVDSVFTSDPVDSGESIHVEITDNVGCAISEDFVHTVPPPCILPCEGQSRRCAYRLWLQPPVGGEPYEDYQQDGKIRITFKGGGFPLLNPYNLLEIDVNSLNNNFEKAIGDAVDILNKEIEKVFVDANEEELSKNRLVLEYAPTSSDPFGVLWIEHFVCEAFEIEFNFEFKKPSSAFSIQMRYTSQPWENSAAFGGAILLNRDGKEIRTPAFDCRERNQCTGSSYKKLCEGPTLEPSLEIEEIESNHFRLTGSVANMSENDIAVWVWDFFPAEQEEPFYEGKTVDVNITNRPRAIRLTVITKKGCFGFTQKNIDP